MSFADDIMQEALQLATDLAQCQDQILEDGLDAIGFISAQQEKASYVGTLDLFADTLDPLGLSVQQLERLFAETSAAIKGYLGNDDDEMLSTWLEANALIDPAKIANEDLLRELELRRDRVFASVESGIWNRGFTGPSLRSGLCPQRHHPRICATPHTQPARNDRHEVDRLRSSPRRRWTLCPLSGDHQSSV